ncbi:MULTISPECIES: hypothetical protein [Streptomyces violaceusniger group]|uniref:Acyl-CoA dehydrogenase n=2 Tax=Streptomyces javensis TaxID=114698 RepID=A0ABN1X8G1_9ACTN|nr:hypothetical protein [Streptomyces javensis]MBI0317473.1 hypothetical protein [Streptomyces javensis]
MTHFDSSDAALDALLAQADAGVLQSVTESLDATRGAGLVHWHAVPDDDVPLASPPDMYAPFRGLHIHGDIEAIAEPGDTETSGTPDSQHSTLAELMATAHRDHEVLTELLGQFTLSGMTYLLHTQLKARIGYLHKRLATAASSNDRGLNGTRAAHLTLAVWDSTRHIRRRLEQGKDDALPPGAVLQAIALCTSIIDAMEVIRDTLFDLFGIEATPTPAHRGYAERFSA